MAITNTTSSKKKAVKVPKAHSGKVISKESYDAKVNKADILIGSLPVANQGGEQVKIQKGPGGRKTHFTEIVLQKLEAAFSIGMTDEESAMYSGIKVRILYDEQKRNPEFLQKKQFWKGNIKRKAVANIATAIASGDEVTSKWYLERKDRKNFGPGISIIDPEKEVGNIVSEEDSEMHAKILKFNLKPGK